jgi:bifunctional non-homologous end joining protein LigD
MSLDEYDRKRQFEQTPEPRGSAAEQSQRLRFVVQKHDATRLHYDFRLELDGVLKSWAVPKGPSMNPEDKRLAMMVEDHPMDYRSFEGVIPKGNYGAGSVMVWDEGFYQPVDAAKPGERDRVLRHSVHKGHLVILLNGKKLRGIFDLVHTHDEKQENAWLLMKRDDVFATDEDVTAQDRSVLTDRTQEEIAEQSTDAGDIWESDKRRALPDLSDAPPAKMPHSVKPMLAVTVDEPFVRDDWVFELKWDGYRILAEAENGGVKLYTRNGIDYTDRFADVAKAFRSLGFDALIDGEVVVLDPGGRPRFSWLQNYPRESEGELVYYAFDVLHLNGHDIGSLPLLRRKEILAATLPDSPCVRVSEHVPDGLALFRFAEEHELEGVVGKKASSRYLEGKRSDSWQKIKRRPVEQAVIGGYSPVRDGGTSLGALLLGQREGDQLKYVGHVGSGFSEKISRELLALLEPLRTDSCPFSEPPTGSGQRWSRPVKPSEVTWVRPELECNVSYSEWTQAGSMRQPVYLGLTTGQATPAEPAKPEEEDEDIKTEKEAVEPVGEQVAETTEVAGPQDDSSHQAEAAGRAESTADAEARDDAAAEAEHEATRRRFRGSSEKKLVFTVDGRSVELSNPTKVFWPDEGWTKTDLAEYYRLVAPYILKHLRDRPESLRRYPDGIKGEAFFHKDVGALVPDWVETVPIDSDSGNDKVYMLCQDEATLLYVVNLGCIDLNPWLSRVESLAMPDYSVIDLDPEAVGFDKVVEAAIAVHEVLAGAKVPSLVKTSGATGMHIFVPLGGRYTYDQSRQFAELVATFAHQKLPASTSLVRNPAQRQGRVYIDFLQNRRGQTLASAYSVRPFPGAPVSTPLEWEEVVPGLDPGQFTMFTLRERLERVGDLWAKEKGVLDLPAFLESLSQG